MEARARPPQPPRSFSSAAAARGGFVTGLRGREGPGKPGRVEPTHMRHAPPPRTLPEGRSASLSAGLLLGMYKRREGARASGARRKGNPVLIIGLLLAAVWVCQSGSLGAGAGCWVSG
jgi:hypothetical protein